MLGQREEKFALLRLQTQRLAQPLDDDKDRGDLPDARQGQKRHRNQKSVAQKGEQPVGLRLVREISGHKPDRVTDKLANTGDQADNRRAFAQRPPGALRQACASYVEFFIARGTLSERLPPEALLDGSFVDE